MGWLSSSRNPPPLKTTVINAGYRLLDIYKQKGETKIIIQDKIGYKYDVFIKSLIRIPIFPIASIANKKFSFENIYIWLKTNRPEFELYEQINSEWCGEKLNFYHKTCNESFYMTWNHMKEGIGCPVCAGHQVGKKTSLAYLRPDIASDWHPIKNGNLTPNDVTCGTSKKVWWLCPKGHEYFSTICGRTSFSSRGCQQCYYSKGEERIRRFLSENNIFYVPQKKFSKCKNERELRFDFGIPYEDGFWKCIEYYGEQHSKPVDFGGKGLEVAKKILKETKQNDKIKQKFCKNNNIYLLIINYWDINNIEDILVENLLREGE